ncbi:MAG TPA: class I SAM-dependent methyltransferase [Candidatus Binataceae bacterium]|nr:class I SAM-dependent methyltransferase [Candidatus Binataceae bacterium]
MSIKRKLKNRAKELLFSIHKLGLRCGVVVLPNHYYIDFPDVIQLAKSKDIWAKPSRLAGVEADLDQQAARLREICAPYATEVLRNPHHQAAVSSGCGPGYGYIEAEALHCVVRSLKPKRIVEVGSGVSTYCILQAAARNGVRCAITCVEPYPSAWLKGAQVALIEKPVQAVPFDLFDALGDGDFLFIDSSHTVKTGSDTNFLILEVLPRLKPGVVVHFHDICLPYDYPRDTLRTFFQWQETALLHAFLIGNRAVEIMFCLSQLHYDRPGVLGELFPEYRAQPADNGLRNAASALFDDAGDHFPSSIYLRVRGAQAVKP